MHKDLLALATFVCLTGMMASPDAAPNRGKAGSKTRGDWCADKFQQCSDAGRESCQKNAQGQLASCFLGVSAACMSSWGSTSSCMTDAVRPQSGTGAVMPPSQRPNTVAPGGPAPNNSPFQRPGNPPVSPPGIEPGSAGSAPTGQKAKANTPK